MSFPNVIAGKSWSDLAADEVLRIHPHYVNYDTPSLAWNYPQGLILYAIWNVWLETHDQKYFDYVKESVAFYLPDTSGIKTYVQDDFRLDDILMGRVILDLYKLSGEAKYKKAAAILREQLTRQPRTPEGGFWHKKIYPNQMWLDGLYMSEPFYAQYAKMFNEPDDFDDIARQFVLMAEHALDPASGLMYHGWDFAKKEKWSNSQTGDSPCFWGRSIGWYMMGLADALDYFPVDHPQRQKLISIFRDLCTSVLKYQDKKTHLWYQIVDRPGSSGNFLESSASAMFAYSFAKGAKEKYLDHEFSDIAARTFDGLVNYSVKIKQITIDSASAPQFEFILENTSGTVGLGGNPYRDGSYEYYVGVPKEENDFRGVGPFILAALQIESSEKAEK
ncbi:MAG TPA: glycoside hydrolase family 88 protein [Candidatus Acidoferrales bacterium]|nr:glycoside hydrolase family 88 protein [Candidatus Acidoferrales bacterium]